MLTSGGVEIMDEEKKRRILHLTCCLLPKCHRDTMEILFSFLNWAASFSHIDEESGSKMDVHNLSTVVTPNILYSQKKEAGMDDSFLAIEAIHTLIACNETMCEVRWKFIGVCGTYTNDAFRTGSRGFIVDT